MTEAEKVRIMFAEVFDLMAAYWARRAAEAKKAAEPQEAARDE